MAFMHQESTISRLYMTARNPLHLHHMCRATRIKGPATGHGTRTFSCTDTPSATGHYV